MLGMNRNKLISMTVLLTLAVLTFLLPVNTVYAENDIIAEIGNMEASPGQTINLPVNLSSSGSISRIEIDLEYDNQLLNCVGSENGSLTQGFTVTQTQLGTRLHAAIFSPEGKTIPQGEGSIAVFKLLVLPTATPGQSSNLHLAGVLVPDPRVAKGNTKVLLINGNGSVNVSANNQNTVPVNEVIINAPLSQTPSANGSQANSAQYTPYSSSPVGPTGTNANSSGGNNPTLNTKPPVPNSNQPPENQTKDNQNQINSGAQLNRVTTSPKDIQNHWAKNHIEKLMALQVVSGYADGSFKPDNSISRAEFAKLIAVALKLTINSNEKLSFADSAAIDSWANPYVAAAVKAGIISGYGDNTFQPRRNISRSEIAVMVVRAMGSSTAADAKLSFIDTESIPNWAGSAVKTAVQAGIITGKPDNRFMPGENATRAEAATIISKLLDNKR